MRYIVSPLGDTPYRTLKSALDAIPDNSPQSSEIVLRAGDYREKVHILKPNVRIVGEGRELTRLSFSDFADQRHADGTIKGTFCSYTLLVAADNVTLENLTLANDAGPGCVVGQALALYAAGDRLRVVNCLLTARQDTVFLGPVMPPVAENALPYVLRVQSEEVGYPPDTHCRAYFEGCVIEGDVDFIFGSYRAYFERCVIRSLPRTHAAGEVNGYITAANTPKDQPYGFVFHQCDVVGEGCVPSSVYLGRPWREHAAVLFLSCHMDASIHPRGFCDWTRPFRAVSARCGEGDCVGPGADPSARHKAQCLLSVQQAQSITREAVLDGWNGQHAESPQERGGLHQ